MRNILLRATGRTRMPSLKRYANRVKREKSIIKAHEEHFAGHRDDYKSLEKYVENFRSSGGLKHQYQVYKLWCLKKLLAQYKPKSILELGSGSSTLVFNEYVKENDARLLSIDENEKWASNTLGLIGEDKSTKTDILVKEKICLPARMPPEIKYDVDIKEKFDFVFIDGPSLQIGSGKFSEAVNSNIFDLPEAPEVVVIDVRKATAEELAKKYSVTHDAFLSDLFTEKPVSEDYRYFSVFQKK